MVAAGRPLNKQIRDSYILSRGHTSGMMFGLKVLMFLISCLTPEVATKEPSEPTCYSRFDYDEKLLLKVLHIQEEVSKFKTRLSELENKQEDDGRKMNASMQTAVGELRQNLQTLRNEVSKNDNTVAFTVKNPSDAADVIAFTDIVTNEGGGYNTATGKFTCSIPGWYYFIAHLVKARKSERVDSTGCYIKKNTESLVKLFIDPGDTNADIGSYGVGNSVIVHLNEGDTVFTSKIGSLSSSTMDEQSSFSGFLVRLT